MPKPELRAPRPPELLSPWRTDARVALQAEARSFARDVVMPLADELDRQKAEMPRSLIDAMARRGWFGITRSCPSMRWKFGVELERPSVRRPEVELL